MEHNLKKGNLLFRLLTLHKHASAHNESRFLLVSLSSLRVLASSRQRGQGLPPLPSPLALEPRGSVLRVCVWMCVHMGVCRNGGREEKMPVGVPRQTDLETYISELLYDNAKGRLLSVSRITQGTAID